MTLEGVGKVVERTTKSKGKKYKKVWIYIPSQIANDSAFPFQAGEKVKIKINLKRRMLEVSKM